MRETQRVSVDKFLLSAFLVYAKINKSSRLLIQRFGFYFISFNFKESNFLGASIN